MDSPSLFVDGDIRESDSTPGEQSPRMIMEKPQVQPRRKQQACLSFGETKVLKENKSHTVLNPHAPTLLPKNIFQLLTLFESSRKGHMPRRVLPEHFIEPTHGPWHTPSQMAAVQTSCSQHSVGLSTTLLASPPTETGCTLYLLPDSIRHSSPGSEL